MKHSPEEMDYKEVELYYEPRAVCKSTYDWPGNQPEMSVFDSAFLCGLIKEKRPHKIVEVGISAGATTAIILKCIQLLALEDECEVFSVDISKPYYKNNGKRSGYLADELLNEEGGHFKHTFLLGKRLPEVIDRIGSDVDFVILDTVHTMPGEILDFLTIFPYLKLGATVVLHDIALNHYNQPTLYAYCNQVLLRSVVADKYFMYDESTSLKYPNIGAFDINENTAQSISDVFHSMTINWAHRLDPKDFKLYCKHFERHYGKDTATLFTTIYQMQDHTYKMIFESVLEKSSTHKPLNPVTNVDTTTDIEQLRQQLKTKGEEIKFICAKLIKGGAEEAIPDDFLDQLLY